VEQNGTLKTAHCFYQFMPDR